MALLHTMVFMGSMTAMAAAPIKPHLVFLLTVRSYIFRQVIPRGPLPGAVLNGAGGRGGSRIRRRGGGRAAPTESSPPLVVAAAAAAAPQRRRMIWVTTRQVTSLALLLPACTALQRRPSALSKCLAGEGGYSCPLQLHCCRCCSWCACSNTLCITPATAQS